MVTTGTAAGAVEMNMDVVMPDKFHMTTTAMEIIVIGKTFYMKVANKWQKVATLGVDLSLADPKKFEANLATTTDIKFAGAEILNGTPTLVYTYTSNVKGPPAQKIPSKMWVGALDNLPRKFEMTPKAGQTTTITYTDYNANITISAPL
jgi:hypothetical protein